MAKYLKQSTASQEVPIGRMLDSIDGETEKTGLTIANTDIKVWKTGATTLASKNSGGATHIANGVYYAVLDATDTDTLGPLKIFVHVSGALAWEDSYTVLPAQVYDSLMGSDLLQVDVTQYGNSNGTFASGIPTVTTSTASNNAIADQVWDEATGGHTTSGSFGAGNFIPRSNTAQAGSGTTITLDASASAVDDFYNNQLLVIVSGTGVGQSRFIDDYVGSTKVATVAAWKTNPDNTSVFNIRPFGAISGATAPTAAEVADAVWDEAASGHTTAGSFGQYVGGPVLNAGTAQTGTGSSITLATSASTTADLYNRNIVTIIGGTGAGQSSQITDYSTGRVATVDPAFTVAPDNTSVYMVTPLGIDAATLAAIADAVWDEARSGHVTAGTFGEYTNADAIRLNSSATAAANAKSAFDGATGYTFTNSVMPSVTTVTGNVNGSVGGSVGSVAGNVSGNVAGSVASVTGNVGGNVVGSVASVSGNVGGSVASVTAGVTLAANAVTTTSVADGAITAAKIASNAITNAKLADGAITAAKCGDNLPANTKAINSVTITGDGSSGDKFDVV